MVIPVEFYYAAISAIIGLLWTNKLNFDAEGRLHFKGRYVGYIFGFVLWIVFFLFTYFVVASITEALLKEIIFFIGEFEYLSDAFLLALTFVTFLVIYKIKIKIKTKEGLKPTEVVKKPAEAVTKRIPKEAKEIPKKISKIKIMKKIKTKHRKKRIKTRKKK